MLDSMSSDQFGPALGSRFSRPASLGHFAAPLRSARGEMAGRFEYIRLSLRERVTLYSHSTAQPVETRGPVWTLAESLRSTEPPSAAVGGRWWTMVECCRSEFTRMRSQVQVLYRPPRNLAFTKAFCALPTQGIVTQRHECGRSSRDRLRCCGLAPRVEARLPWSPCSSSPGSSMICAHQ